MKDKIINWFWRFTGKLDDLTGIPYDKIRHFFVGFGIDFSVSIFLFLFFALLSLIMDLRWSGAHYLIVIIPFVLVILAAWAKESKDRYEGRKFDWIDLLATLLGGVISKIIILTMIAL